jgi:proline iminopeptidase
MAREPYPEIEPYQTGYLDVGSGHRIYWEECGNPDGKPAVVLHGGPGSGCTPGNRGYFDPARYRIVIFDQRNAGRSLPYAGEPHVDLSQNTTQNLVQDMEALRESLGIERWLVKGASWGSVLGLVYAEAHPDRVSELLLISMGVGRRSETDLMTTGFAPLFPEAWRRFSEFAATAPEGDGVIDRYHRLLFDADPSVREEAARRWCEWEMAILPTASGPSPRFESPTYRLAFARIVTHYWRSGSWLEEGEILAKADRLAGIPGAILQGRLDLSNLSGSPWELANRWPGSELVFIEDSGHEGSQQFRDVLLSFTDRFAGRG